MKTPVLRIAVWLTLFVCAISIYRAMTSTTDSTSKTWRELQASSKAVEIRNAILSDRMEDHESFYLNIEQYYEQVMDPWGNPYHIAIADSNVSNIVISGVDVGGPVAVWSNGKNKKNENGKGDDITSWKSGQK